MCIAMAKAANAAMCFVMLYFGLFSGSQATEAPSFIEEPSDVIAQKNRPAKLNCSVKGDPRPRIQWKLNNETLVLSNDSQRKLLPDGSLSFSQIVHVKGNKPDEGSYQCIAQSRINNVEYVLLSRTATLRVAGLSSKITVEVSPQPARVYQGDIARFLCVVRHAVPTPVIQWRRVGSTALLRSNNKHWILPNGVLYIHDVQHAVDSGEYECIATNPVSQRQHVSSPARLDTLPATGFPRKIKFVAQPSPTNTTQGEQVVLECTANGHPQPAISWFKDSVALVMESRMSLIGRSILLINSASPSDSGSYKCKATSQGVTQESAPAHLQVYSPPKFTKQPQTSHAYVDSDARFECAADGFPKPVITWRKNGEIQRGSFFLEIGDGYLIVKALVQLDMGVYQCFASNGLGNIQAAAELLVYRKGVPIPQQLTTTLPANVPTTSPSPQPQYPGPPLNVRGQALSDTEVKVSWSPPVNPHGKVISYNVFYSPKDGPGGIIRLNTSGNSLSIIISNLRPNTKYKVHVYANNQHGSGAISAEAVIKTAASDLKPSAPRAVLADAKSESTVRVTWGEPATGLDSVARYVISYSESALDDYRQVTTKEQTVVLRQLQTYTEYNIKVHAENKKGLRGPSASAQVTTRSGVPLSPPLDFTLTPDGVGTGLIATWKAPNIANGQITFYVIKFRKVGSTQASKTKDIGAEKQQYSLQGLQPDTDYEAKIAAVSDAGLGPHTATWVQASTKTAKCREDQVPGPPTNVKTKPFEKVIHLTWSPPENAGRICVRRYIVRWGRLMPYGKDRTVSAGVRTTLLTELTPNQKYVISIEAENNAGNGLAALKDESTAGGTPPPMPVKILHALPLSSRVVRVSWLDKSLLRAPVYHVFSLRSGGTFSYCGNTTTLAINCTGLRPYTEFRFYVRRNDDKRNATAKNRTMEDVPGPPVDLTGSPDENDFSTLQLHWQVPEVTNGPIREYKIYYSTDKNAPLKEWGSKEVPGSQMVATITSLTHKTRYYFKMKARTKRGWGKLSAVKEILTPPYPSTPASPTGSPAVGGESTPAKNSSAPAAAAQTGGDLGDRTLWIAIAAVAGITLIAIIIISIILCKKRSGDDLQRRPPPTYKSVIQSNGSTRKKTKEEKPDLWVSQQPAEPAVEAAETPSQPAQIARSVSTSEAVPLEYMKLNASKTSFHSDGDADTDPDVFPTPPPATNETQWGGPEATPDQGRPHPTLPATSTPLHDPPTADGAPPTAAPSHRPAYQGPTSPIERAPPPATLPKPASRTPVTPADDIQLPAVGFSHLPPGLGRPSGPPNGQYAQPPKYDELFSPPSPPKDSALVKAELEQEMAGLEGLLKDLDTIRSEDFQL